MASATKQKDKEAGGLKATVHTRDPQTGALVTYEPGDNPENVAVSVTATTIDPKSNEIKTTTRLEERPIAEGAFAQDYSKMDEPRLRKELAALHLDTSGDKKELVERLENAPRP